MALVKMTHPALEGRTIEVDELAVKHHERSGWKLATAPARARKRAASEETK